MNKEEALALLRGKPGFYYRYSGSCPGETDAEIYGYFFDTKDDLKYLADCIAKNVNPSDAFIRRRFGKLRDVITEDDWECDADEDDEEIFLRDGDSYDSINWHKYFYKTDKDGKIFNKVFNNSPEFREKALTIDNVANDNTGGNSMSKASETMQMVVSMKMLKGLMSDGKGKEADLGKLMIMQQMMSGEKLQVSDVLKAKLINEFSLDESKDLPLEKVMLLQMLDGGEIDITQLISMKMFGELFKDEEKTKDE